MSCSEPCSLASIPFTAVGTWRLSVQKLVDGDRTMFSAGSAPRPRRAIERLVKTPRVIEEQMTTRVHQVDGAGHPRSIGATAKTAGIRRFVMLIEPAGAGP